MLIQNAIINVPLLMNLNDVFRHFKFANADTVCNFFKIETIDFHTYTSISASTFN